MYTSFHEFFLELKLLSILTVLKTRQFQRFSGRFQLELKSNYVIKKLPIRQQTAPTTTSL